jgi:hypothetical protein
MSEHSIQHPKDASAILDSENLNPAITNPEVSDAASKPFVGRWLKLASETNWEKGRIILEWRNALIASEASSSQYSDEAWANRVGFVTCQHVGRLRRVYERFGETYNEYPKLYWSHFWAAIDWDDAELWLEGASSSRWSITQMCRMRAESMRLPEGQTALGFVASETQRIESETDDGFLESTSSATGEQSKGREAASDQDEDSPNRGKEGFESRPLNEDPDFGDQDIQATGNSTPTLQSTDDDPIVARNPFEGLGKLPLDIVEALDPLKLSILRYRSNQWQGFSKQQMLDLIEALKGFCE